MAKVTIEVHCKDCKKRKRPKRPKNLWLLLREGTMALVNLNWTKSVSVGVVKQHLNVLVNGVVAHDLDLDPLVETFPFTANENAVLHVELWCNDGVMDSAHAVLDVVVPDMTPLMPPTNLHATFA